MCQAKSQKHLLEPVGLWGSTECLAVTQHTSHQNFSFTKGHVLYKITYIYENISCFDQHMGCNLNSRNFCLETLIRSGCTKKLPRGWYGKCYLYEAVSILWGKFTSSSSGSMAASCKYTLFLVTWRVTFIWLRSKWSRVFSTMADARTWFSIRTKFQAAAYANARLLPDKSMRRLVVLYRFTILEPLKQILWEQTVAFWDH